MTRYILAGGADRHAPDYPAALEAAVGTMSQPPRILSCLFAVPREDWEEKLSQFVAFFKGVFGEATVCTLAFPDTFYEQAAAADIIYIHGGDDALLAHYMESYPDLTTRLFKDKIVVGSSAGASFLSSSYWTCDWRAVRKGSGITPFNVVVHYESDFGATDPRGPIDWQQARAELQAHVGAEAVTPLAEGAVVAYDA
jgi:hypothetical protein